MYSYDDIQAVLNGCLEKIRNSAYNRELVDLHKESKESTDPKEIQKIEDAITVKDFIRQFEQRNKTETDFAASQQGFDGYIDHVKAALNRI